LSFAIVFLLLFLLVEDLKAVEQAVAEYFHPLKYPQPSPTAYILPRNKRERRLFHIKSMMKPHPAPSANCITGEQAKAAFPMKYPQSAPPVKFSKN
jgi:hypothetical protein